MPRWRSWDERRREIQRELLFAAAGIGDLVNGEPDDSDDSDDDDETPRCPECGEISPCEFERSRE